MKRPRPTDQAARLDRACEILDESARQADETCRKLRRATQSMAAVPMPVLDDEDSLVVAMEDVLRAARRDAEAERRELDELEPLGELAGAHG